MSGTNNSYWLKTVPAWELDQLPLPSYADIAIIGAGVMGSALGYWLARAGRKPLVIERNPSPAMGATGRNGGLMVQGSSFPFGEDIKRFGAKQAHAIYAFTQWNHRLVREVLSTEELDVGFEEVAHIRFASDAADVEMLQNTVAALRDADVEAQWVEGEALSRAVGTEVGPQFVGALLRPNQGRVHSARYTHGSARAATLRGARFAFSTPVQSVETNGSGWAIRTARTTIPANQVVLALNAWSADLFPELESIITPTRGHAAVTSPANWRMNSWSAENGFAYGRQLENGQLLFGGARNVRADMEVGHHPLPGENVAPLVPEVVEALSQALPRYFPATADLKIEHVWTGNMGFTPDMLPLVGEWPNRTGLWLMTGFSGHGMCYSQAVPRALADQIMGREGIQIPNSFDPARYLDN